MSNPYYSFLTPFIPGNKVRSGPVNTQFSALQAAFDLLPASPTAPTHGTTTFAIESGLLNAYVVAMPNTRISNTEGDEVVFKATHDCTGPSTLAVDAVPAVPLRRFDGTPLQAGDILTGKYYAVRFDSANTQFVIVYPIMVTVTGGITYANPTAQVGLTAVNGVAATVMRSDAAPALNVGIAPTWSATHTFSLTPVVPNSSWTYAKIQNVSATSRFLGRVTAGAGVIEELTGAQAAGLIPSATLTYAQIQNVSATSRFHGRITAGAGVMEELTGTQATTLLDTFTTGLKGLVPASGGGTTNFLRADGTFNAPPGFQSYAAVKPADTSRTNSTPTADPDLVINSIPVGTYRFECYIMFNQAAASGGGFSMNGTFSGTATLLNSELNRVNGASSAWSGGSGISNWTGLFSTAQATNTTLFDGRWMAGTLVVTVSGNLGFTWQQATTNAAATTLKAGSFMYLTKIA